MATFLELGLINADSSVMRLLPPEIAFQYHALPVATDGNHITVAMAEPEDQQASKAIQAAIDRPICFIHADPGLIDRQLHHLWPVNTPHPLLLTWFPEGATLIDPFINNLADMLNADLDNIVLPPDESDSIKYLGGVISDRQPDLLIFRASQASRVLRRILKETMQKGVIRLSSFLAVPPSPVWPIRKLLFVLPDNKTRFDLAAGWTEKLAGPSNIQVTILPVLPPIPLCYGSFLRHNLNAILAGKDQLGLKMRQIADRLAGENIQGAYKLREGDPLTQIENEINASQPDLIIMPFCFHSGCKTWLNADLPRMLFKTLNIPMLFTSEN